MKLNRTLIACAALGLVAAFSTTVRAEVSNAAPAVEQPAHAAKKPRTRLESLTQKLHLTDAQQLQVSAIIKDQQAAEAALKADTASGADAKKAKRKEIAAAHNAKIRELLNPEQQGAFDETLSHHFGAKPKM